MIEIPKTLVEKRQNAFKKAVDALDFFVDGEVIEYVMTFKVKVSKPEWDEFMESLEEDSVFVFDAEEIDEIFQGSDSYEMAKEDYINDHLDNWYESQHYSDGLTNFIETNRMEEK